MRNYGQAPRAPGGAASMANIVIEREDVMERAEPAAPRIVSPIGTAAAAQGAVGAEPPTSAQSLLDGTLDEWIDEHGQAARWRLVDGAVEVRPGSGDIFTRRSFFDFQLHLEFWLPAMPDAEAQSRANSGIFLQGRYELQILDSFGMEAEDDGCGAFYKAAAPLWNACRKPQVWQVFDVAFRARGDGGARATVFLNGILVHNNVLLAAPTAGALAPDIAWSPLRLQDHGSLVRFRNIWIASTAI
jgi:hypothetical protein